MLDATVHQIEKTWTHVLQDSSLGEKLEYGSEAVLGFVALAAVSRLGLARYARAAESALPELSIKDLPALEKVAVFAIERENVFNVFEGYACLVSRIRGKAGEVLGDSRFIDASSAKTADELVAQISRNSEGRPLKEVLIESHGNINAVLSLSGPEPSYPLGESATQSAFKSLNMTSDSRLTFLGCKMASGPSGAEDLQRFADGTGIRTRAFEWIQWSGSHGFGPYVEAIPGHTEQLHGFRRHWDALLYPATIPPLGWSLNMAKRKVKAALSSRVAQPAKP
jgi:hypothetical protein